jgi:type IV pilus assembly protein PilN
VIHRFNLLPHRAQKQLWQKRVLARQAVLVLAIAVLTALMIHSIIIARLNYLEAYNERLQSTVTQIIPEFRTSQQILKQRDDMLERQKVLEGLDARRSTSVLILDDVARALPTDVYLTRLEEDGERFRLEGRAINNAAIIRLFELLVRSERLSDMRLEEIHMQEGESLAPYVFLMIGSVRLPVTGNNVMAGRSRD